jgi:hypothetical protein
MADLSPYFFMNTKGKDLTKEPPRSPKVRVGGYAILGRTIDKCRALLWGNLGEYHFDCPLDNMLFGFKGIKGHDFKAFVETGASDDDIEVDRSQWYFQKRRRKARLERGSDERQSLSQPGETRLVRRRSQVIDRTGSKDDAVV